MSSRPARPGTTGHASKPGRRGGGRKQGEGRGRPASSGEALKAKEEEYRSGAVTMVTSSTHSDEVRVLIFFFVQACEC